MSLSVVFHPIYSQLSLPRNHRFPIEKYQALHDAALAKYPNQINVHQVDEPINQQMLELVHEPEYIQAFISGSIDAKAMKRIGFPWSEQFVLRTRTACAGTLKTAELAAEHGCAINLTGGYHHAFPGEGSGFCVFNDLTIAAKHLVNSGAANRVLIFDCDVHQGDGTAVCTQNDANIFSLSLHCQKNFPTRKQQSDWDIGLDRYINDDIFLEQVNDALHTAVNSFKPDFIIYDAGVDIHENDDLGLLNVSTAGVYQRDKMVFSAAKQADIPIMAVIGGGYQRDIKALTEVHMQLINAAMDTMDL